jgi:hypothetical protein
MLWERELQSLEAAIFQLNAAYDVFLYGSAMKPPVEMRKQVERTIRRLNSREAEAAADRYRFTALQGRYNALCERWDRLQAQKEAGKRPGVYGGFVRDARHLVPTAATGTTSPNASDSASVESSVDRDADLFEKYLAARKSRGEDVRGYDLARFKESLEQERERLKERFGDVDVEFEVAEREGRVKLVARPKTTAPPEAPESGSEEKR